MIAAVLVAGFAFFEPEPLPYDTVMIVDTLFVNRGGVAVTDTTYYEVRVVDGGIEDLKSDMKKLRELLKARKGK